MKEPRLSRVVKLDRWPVAPGPEVLRGTTARPPAEVLETVRQLATCATGWHLASIARESMVLARPYQRPHRPLARIARLLLMVATFGVFSRLPIWYGSERASPGATPNWQTLAVMALEEQPGGSQVTFSVQGPQALQLAQTLLQQFSDHG